MLHKTFEEQVEQIVCNFIGIAPKWLYLKCRREQVVVARQVICYILRERTPKTLEAIGQRYGQRHANVHHSINRVLEMLDANDKYSLQILQILETVNTIKDE